MPDPIVPPGENLPAFKIPDARRWEANLPPTGKPSDDPFKALIDYNKTLPESDPSDASIATDILLPQSNIRRRATQVATQVTSSLAEAETPVDTTLLEDSGPRPSTIRRSVNTTENLNRMRQLAGLPEITMLIEDDIYIPKGTPWEIDPETGQQIIPDSLKQLQLLHQKNNPDPWKGSRDRPPPPVLPKPRQTPQKIPDAPQVPGNRGQGSGDTRSNASPPVIPTVPPTNRANPNTPNAAAPVVRPPDKSWIDSLKWPDWEKEWSKTFGDDPDFPLLAKPKDQPKKSLLPPEIDKSIDDIGSAIGGAGSAIGGAIGGAGSAIKRLWRGGDAPAAPAAPTAPTPVEPVAKADTPPTDDWDWRKTLGLFDPRKPLPKSWEPPAKVATPEPKVEPKVAPILPPTNSSGEFLGGPFRPYSRPKDFDPLVSDDELEPARWGQLIQRPAPVPQKQAQQPTPPKKVPNTDSTNGEQPSPPPNGAPNTDLPNGEQPSPPPNGAPQPGEKAPPGTKNDSGPDLKKEPEIPPEARSGPGRLHFPPKSFFAPDGRPGYTTPNYPPYSGVDPGEEDPEWIEAAPPGNAAMGDMRKLAGLPPAEPIVEKGPFPRTGKNPPSFSMREGKEVNPMNDSLALMKRLAGLG